MIINPGAKMLSGTCLRHQHTCLAAVRQVALNVFKLFFYIPFVLEPKSKILRHQMHKGLKSAKTSTEEFLTPSLTWGSDYPEQTLVRDVKR